MTAWPAVSLYQKATLRRWARACGFSSATPGGVLSGVLATSLLFGAIGAIVVARLDTKELPTSFALLATGMLYIGVGGVTSLLLAAADPRSSSGLGMDELPLSSSVRASCILTPVALLCACVVGALWPAAGLLVAKLASTPAPVVGARTSLVVLGAIADGLMAGAFAGFVASRVRRLHHLQVAVAIGCWATIAGLHGLLVRRLSGGAQGGWLAQLAGWPDAATTEPFRWSAFLASLGWLSPHICASALVARHMLRDESRTPAVVLARPYSPRCAWTLASLQRVRMLRNRAQLAGLLGATILMSAAVLLVRYTPNSRAESAKSMLLPLAIAAAHPLLVARSTYERSEPYALVAGIPPRRFSRSVVVGALEIVAVPWLVFLVALSIVADDPQPAVLGVGLGAMCAGISAFVGTVLIPGDNNAIGELVGMVLVGGMATVMLQGLGRANINEAGVTVIGLVVGGAFVGGCGLIEERRWRRKTGGLT